MRPIQTLENRLRVVEALVHSWLLPHRGVAGVEPVSLYETASKIWVHHIRGLQISLFLFCKFFRTP